MYIIVYLWLNVLGISRRRPHQLTTMAYRITHENLHRVLSAPPELLSTLLPELFEKLLQPDQDAIFIQDYVVELVSSDHVCSPQMRIRV
jgi:hypothetical protein